jgi:hypothetical protein
MSQASTDPPETWMLTFDPITVWGPSHVSEQGALDFACLLLALLARLSSRASSLRAAAGPGSQGRFGRTACPLTAGFPQLRLRGRERERLPAPGNTLRRWLLPAGRKTALST